ncbi:MAG: 4-alpha-glucanotransferase [bacterium]|nr:4-alpha-glucanotransferase [bacterium]
MRSSGILLPISALPGKYGIGCFSKEAYAFVDFLADAGQTLWQILPLGPTSYGDSPYQSFSTFAGNPYFISLEQLIEEGVLTEAECEAMDFGSNETSIDYGKLYESRFNVLRLAYERTKLDNSKEYAQFLKENAHWIEDYALYMAIKMEHDAQSWSTWEDEIRLRQPQAMAEYRKKLATEIDFYKYMQFKFYEQWEQLKGYANEKGIRIIGDIPIYVAFDSSDAWANPDLFQFDENCEPISVAGCPPDGFSATGQLWGNPLYRWEVHKETGYEWWIQRIKACYKMYDIIRIDHFRGFDEYYSIPATDETAEFGHWEKGPGYELFEAIEAKLGKLNIIVEDLGFITDSVRELVAKTGWPNMKVLEFAFDSRDSSGPNEYIPFRYNSNCVVYTGTHDNETLFGWLDSICEEDYALVEAYLDKKGADKRSLVHSLIVLAMSSVAERCVIPMQDHLGLDNDARMNTPSTLGGNWQWRMKSGQLTKKLAKEIFSMSVIYGRAEKRE